MALDTFTVSGETIDLPNVNGWSLRDAGVATRAGDGWRYEAVNPTKRLSLTVNVRPRGL